MAQAVLFDIDGTLIRTGGAGVEAFDRAGHTAFGIRHGTRQMKFAGRTDTGLVREFFHHHRIDPTPERSESFLNHYVHWLAELLPQHTGETCPGVLELIAGLRRVKNPPLIGLLTGNIVLGAQIKLRHYDLWEQFSFGAFADRYENRDHIAHHAHAQVRAELKRDLRGEEIIVVGDTPHDIRCGRAIGAKVLAVATGGSAYEELQAHHPDWLVQDLRDITAAALCPRPA
jgi:phosphoglycolate phosphatase-like HAD superfamily hydrolase